MSNIIGVTTIDPLKQGKDCEDFQPLKLSNNPAEVGDPKYCHLSRLCKQIGMRTDWYMFINEKGEEDFDYFCRGQYATIEDKGVDEKIS